MFIDMSSWASKFCVFTNKQNKIYKNGQTKPNDMNSNPSRPAVTSVFYLKCLNHSNKQSQSLKFILRHIKDRMVDAYTTWHVCEAWGSRGSGDKDCNLQACGMRLHGIHRPNQGPNRNFNGAFHLHCIEISNSHQFWRS